MRFFDFFVVLTFTWLRTHFHMVAYSLSHGCIKYKHVNNFDKLSVLTFTWLVVSEYLPAFSEFHKTGYSALLFYGTFVCS